MFDEQQPGYTTLSLFPEGRPDPRETVDRVQVKLHEMKLRRARPYGNCWLGCELWRQLELDRFWEQKRERGREAGSWAQVLELLVVNRRIEPGSELRWHRQWFDPSDHGARTLARRRRMHAGIDRECRCGRRIHRGVAWFDRQLRG